MDTEGVPFAILAFLGVPMRSGLLLAVFSVFVTVSVSCSAMADLMAVGSDPKKALQDQAGPGTCCVNQQFFDCPTGSATLECAIADNNCTLACMAEHGPKPAGCTRVVARDGECPQPK
jgi:hypothetical protein